MKLELITKLNNCRILWRDSGCSYFASGMTLCKKTDFCDKPLYKTMIGSSLEKALSLYRPLRQLLRVGIHHCIPLSDGGLIAVVRKKIYRLGANGKAQIVMHFQRGNKPASKGVCITPNGAIFIGEYAQNMQRTLPVCIFRSIDGGKTFQLLREFPPGDIRHIHFIQWDLYENCLWMGTGDNDSESRIYASWDNGDHWRLIGGGSQLWRAVGIAIRPEALYWGTDAGYDTGTHPNFIVRLDRKTKKIEKMHRLRGPCHGSTVVSDGTLLVTTGVEGGRNEFDKYAHLWGSEDGMQWTELLQLKKDFWPKLLQFGVIRFPNGLVQNKDFAFTTFGLSNAGETTFVGKLH